MKFEKRGIEIEITNVRKNYIGGISFDVTVQGIMHPGHFSRSDDIEFTPPVTFPGMGKIGGIGLTPAQQKAIRAELTAPEPESTEALKARLAEIAKEAKGAKSDAVLRGLATERQGILQQIGQKCAGCGEYFLPDQLRHGYCGACYMEGRFGE